jgi:hypothetical protein
LLSFDVFDVEHREVGGVEVARTERRLLYEVYFIEVVVAKSIEDILACEYVGDLVDDSRTVYEGRV